VTKYPIEHKYGDPYYCAICDKEVKSIADGQGYFGSSNGGFMGYVMAHHNCIHFFREACWKDKTRDYLPTLEIARELYRKETQNVAKEQGKV
jgi:hypothetical protein